MVQWGNALGTSYDPHPGPQLTNCSRLAHQSTPWQGTPSPTADAPGALAHQTRSVHHSKARKQQG
ncbi:hypothetical protein IAQ61_006644 [Plenodomus lingam]|uniref:uncharacterized protein n=1 Tax=Leptosphaeria maculans TaxID=5022 RepID=UPI0033229674|nr:hypothetical protein IAQ61_006644 [Plenodomus lingam]